jgi:hypothetical protein
MTDLAQQYEVLPVTRKAGRTIVARLQQLLPTAETPNCACIWQLDDRLLIDIGIDPKSRGTLTPQLHEP